MTTSQLDITNESQEVSPLQAGNHKAPTNRRARKHNKTRQKQLTQMINKRSSAPQQSAKLFHWRAQTSLTAHQPHPSPDVDQTHRRPVHMKDPQLINDTKRRQSKDKDPTATNPNTRAKEIQQVNPSGPDNSQSIRPLPSHQ